MKRWQTDFLDALRRGVPVSLAAKQFAGLPLASVYDKREEDMEFADAWDKLAPSDDDSDGLSGTRVLTAGTLEKVLRAQVSDEEAAAFFGMKEDVFKQRIAENGRLAKVYDTAREGGRAELRVSQFDAAIEGDKALLTWLGKQYLGQSDKIEHKAEVKTEGQPVSITNIILRELPTDQLERLLAQAQGHGFDLVIDGVAERVDEQQLVEDK